MATEYDLGNVKGLQGETGIQGTSIVNVLVNPQGNLIVTLSSGTQIDAGNIRGEKGEKGDKGKSAYEQAQQGGYAGTEAQFIIELNSISSKANLSDVYTKTVVDSKLLTKAPLASPAFTGTATLGGKQIPTMESGTCELSLGGSLTNGSFVYILRTGEYTRIGNYIDIRGTIEISEVISVPTGEVAIYGLPGIPKNTGIFSINYLRGGQDESMRNCYFAQLIGGKFVFKTLTPSSANPLTAGTLNIVYWGTTARIVTGKKPITVQFATRYFTD